MPQRAAQQLLDARRQLTPHAEPARDTPAGGPPRADVLAARDRLARHLGAQAVVDVDPLTGAVDHLQRLDGALTDPSAAAPAAIARGYLADHATALGLTAADAAALTVDDRASSPSGLTVVDLRQAVDGIPTFDDGVRVGIDRAGRVLSVAGAPRADLPADLPNPALSADDALQRLMDATGIRRAITVTSTAADAQRTTRFSTGDTAQLVLFGARTPRLAWHLTFDAGDGAWFDAVVDAASGAVLYRANLVKSATAQVYDNYPGAPQGGTLASRSLDPYLPPGATTLSGPNVHAFADVNADDLAQLGEEVDPTTIGAARTMRSSGTGACDAEHLCGWNHAVPTSWQLNRAQTVAQGFWYANRFHDFLAAPPIGFGAADGAFEGDDPLQLNALDGAATGPGGGPDAEHLDNASMATPPDGAKPRMEMFLWSNGDPAAGVFRDVSGSDDAAIVFHEYAHGLSGRLITNGAGATALGSAQASAMGEGWSDWYAEDWLVRNDFTPDDPTADGDVDVGRYVDAAPHGIRTEAMDCAVGSTDAACPGTTGAGAGGYTYGDLGHVVDADEAHADGEIWAQTLWQLRTVLVSALDEDDGSDLAERLITDAMRLSPPEPSFLDMRNAILAADVNATGGANATRIWDVFRSRGMGFYAATAGSDDTAVVEDFSPPPAADAPRGAIAGTITDADSGLPIAGAGAAVSGFTARIAGAPLLAAMTGGDGRYAIADVPEGSYPKVTLRAPGYDGVVQPVTVAGGRTTTLDRELVRDWAAAPGGAAITSTTDDDGAPYGCGAAALIDQDPGVGWSAVNTTASAPPSTVVRLPSAITVTAFGIDPTNICGDDAGASTRDYRIETSPDGQAWQVAATGSLDAAARGHVTRIAPTDGTDGVRFVRLTLLSPLDPAADYVDVSELEVYGQSPNTLPFGTLVPSSPRVEQGATVILDASSFRDPDSRITGYDWDFDGDGRTDETTADPSTTTAYARPGTFHPAVAVRDVRGGAGLASASLTVVATALPPSAKRKARPLLGVPRPAGHGRVRVRVVCRATCRVSGTLTLSRAAQRRGHLRRSTVDRLGARRIRGTRTVTLRVPPGAGHKLRHHRLRRVRVTVRLQARVTGGGPRASRVRSLRLRL